MNFQEIVKREFGFLVSEYGFAVKKVSGHQVTFACAGFKVEVTHTPAEAICDVMIHVEDSEFLSRFTVYELEAVEGTDSAIAYPHGTEAQIRQLAMSLRRYGGATFRHDQETLKRIAANRRRLEGNDRARR